MHTGQLYYQDYLPYCIEQNHQPASYPYFMHIWADNFQKNAREWKIVTRDESRKKKFHECPFCAEKKRMLSLLPKEDVRGKKQLRQVMLVLLLLLQ